MKAVRNINKIPRNNPSICTFLRKKLKYRGFTQKDGNTKYRMEISDDVPLETVLNELHRTVQRCIPRGMITKYLTGMDGATVIFSPKYFNKFRKLQVNLHTFPSMVVIKMK